MSVQTDTATMSGLVVLSNGHEAADMSQPQPAQPHQLSLAEVVLKTAVGAALFLAWLLLFVLGMSLDSTLYSRLLMNADNSLNWPNMVTYGLLFTPTNGAVLASLAGVLGGIASNLTANNKFRYSMPDLTDTQSEDFISYTYMTENSLVSMLRGFITYLIFIAGSYLTNFTDTTKPDQFVGLTASSYFKFAVSVSLLAYLAGYDPSRMKGLINSFNLTRKTEPPAPSSGNVSAHIVREKTEINAQLSSGPPVNGVKQGT